MRIHPALAGLGAVSLIGLAALAVTLPYHAGDTPAGEDLQFHIANAYEYLASLEAGIVVAHHTPHYFAGVGGINFKYYSPYAYLPVAGLVRLGLPLASAFALALGLSFFVSGVGMYRWARLRQGRPGALVCALLYMAAPYHLDDLFRRFAYPELWGMALAPWVFWAASLVLLRRRRAAMPLACLSLALLGLTHSLSAVMVSGLLVVFWLMVGGLGPGSLVRLAGVILGALALGAFYALPAVLDRGEILLSRQFQNASGYVLRGLRLSQFLTPGTSAGGGTIGPGAAFLLLGLLGWVGLHVGTRRREGGGHARFAAAVGVSAAASLVLASRSGAHLAHAIPALRFLQFPWRFQLTASLFLALAAGALADRGRVVRWRAAVLAVLGTATLIHGFAGGMPDRVALPTRAEFRALMGRYDWTGDVQNKYAPVLAVDAGSIGYRTDRERRAWFVRGEGSIRRVDNGIEHIRLGVRTLSPAWEVAIRRYYVSGWVATAERGIVGVEPDPATGLIRVRGSGDAGVVDLEYVGSRAYRWGIRLSSVAALVVALLLCTGAWRDRRNRPVPARPGRPA